MFVSVVMRAADDNRLNYLMNLIQKIDPTQRRWIPYLQDACTSFNEMHRYDLLHAFLVRDLQSATLILKVYLKEHIRAGTACIKLFISVTEDFGLQIKYLQEAKKHFSEGTRTFCLS